MHRALLALLFTVVACAGPAAAPALATSEAEVPGGFADVAIDPAGARGVGISRDIAPGSQAGNLTMRLYATALDAAGHPNGSPRMFAPVWSPDLMGPHLISVATDTRRARYLVAYSASEPGMGASPCEPAPAPSSPEAASIAAWLNPGQASCVAHDDEIFVRVLDRAGRAVGPEHQVSSIGPPASGLFRSGAASVAYDARSDSYLVTFAALVTGSSDDAALVAQRLRPDGSPLGEARTLELQPESLAKRPNATLVADPRGGYLLVYIWGEYNRQTIYARRLTSGGAPSGPTTTLSGKGAYSFELAFDRRRRRALVVYTVGYDLDEGRRARLVDASGRPVGDIVDLPYGPGVSVAAEPASGRWIYGFSRRGKILESQAFVQSTDRLGRPRGVARALSPAQGADGTSPLLTTWRPGTVLARWAVSPVVCDDGGGCTTTAGETRLRVIRP